MSAININTVGRRVPASVGQQEMATWQRTWLLPAVPIPRGAAAGVVRAHPQGLQAAARAGRAGGGRVRDAPAPV